MLSFETRSPAPRSSRPFFLSAGDMVGSGQPLKLVVQTSMAIQDSHHRVIEEPVENRIEVPLIGLGIPVVVPLT